VLVAITDPQQRVFSFRSFRLVREKARFFCTGAPVLGIIRRNLFAMRAPDSRCNFVTPEQEIRSAM
jgi:hypothetical protein